MTMMMAATMEQREPLATISNQGSPDLRNGNKRVHYSDGDGDGDDDDDDDGDGDGDGYYDQP